MRHLQRLGADSGRGVLLAERKEWQRYATDIPLDRKWTDEKLYERYGLTKVEIAFIESMVRPMGASDE